MKKEYIRPSIKEVKTILESTILAGSTSAKEDINWGADESAAIGYTGYENSTLTGIDWEF